MFIRFCCLNFFQLLLLLLLSRFSCVWLRATPETAAHQAPPSLGFPRQEHWSGLLFPSPMHESEKGKWSHSVTSESSRPHGLQPTRLLCPWDIPGKSTGVGCHCLLWEGRLVSWKVYTYLESFRSKVIFEWTPGAGDGQGGLACCNSWGHKESDTTERLNWTDK